MFVVKYLDGETWKQASGHTSNDDALAQKQRFIDAGLYTEENLQIAEEEYSPEEE